jgi:hypothetical protein
MDSYTNSNNDLTWWEINSAKPKMSGAYEVHCKDGKTYTVLYTGDYWDTTYLKSEMVCFLARDVVLKVQPYLTNWEELRD